MKARIVIEFDVDIADGLETTDPWAYGNALHEQLAAVIGDNYRAGNFSGDLPLYLDNFDFDITFPTKHEDNDE